ncbi:hypothetical protein RSK20926_01362 [Roseobacter sp. SK209-2-6]|nr:hypothetical protein RSK20926_01362 [Roseobacter sp. SK209-2-6]
MIELARQYGCYGYRRIAVLLRDAGWSVSDGRVERLWRREGLKAPAKQPKKGRLWLNDGSCVRLRPEYQNHVWSYDFVHCRTDDGKAFRTLNIIDDLSERIDTARLSVKALEDAVNPDEVGQRPDTFLNLISRQMSEYARHLDLEHGSDSVRLDLKKLTVVADTPTRPISLNQMGSAENWVNYHVLTHLSLHHWYRNQKRPVPGFMIFDQPSQAHYPPDRDQNEDGSLEPLGDADCRAVHDLFKLVHSVAQDIGDGFQCIVLDHARIAEPWFNESIVEEWRGDRRLVPLGWAD